MVTEQGEVTGWRLRVHKPMTFRGRPYGRGDTFPSALEEEAPRKVQSMIDSGKIRRVPVTGTAVAESINDPTAEERRAQILAAGGAALGERPARRAKKPKEVPDGQGEAEQRPGRPGAGGGAE